MQVTMHKASDGTLHETHELFAAHETAVKIKAGVEAARFDLSEFEQDERGDPALYRESLAAFIAANADTLRAILSTAVVVKRGRKSGTKKVAA